MMAGKTARSGFSEHFLTSFDGTRLYFRRYGSVQASRTILCLAGMARSSSDYHELATLLSRRNLVICPDYRGVGRSQRPRNLGSYSPQGWLGDIRALLASLNAHKVVFIGTSFGGLLAAAMAVAAPTTVAGAVLNDIGPEFGDNALGLVSSHIGRFRRFPSLDDAVDYMKSAFPDMPARTEEEWRRITENTFREENGAYVNNWDPAIGKVLIGMRRERMDLWPLFYALARFPILAFRGEKSELLSAETFERMNRRLAGIKGVTVSDVGHAPDLAKPDWVETIEGFLEELS
ncbi:MAG: alpha/beta hydrolase [Rhodospirillales bacterium]|nr:alpha/beta hydrolase [Rhodospirillales bacterium]